MAHAKKTHGSHDDMGGVDLTERTKIFHRFVKVGFVMAALTALTLILLAMFKT